MGFRLGRWRSLAFDLDTTATKLPSLERVGIDLDEIQQPLDGYKVVTRMLPQISTENTQNTQVFFEFGASDIPNQTRTIVPQLLSISQLIIK